jgi:hypothetical protein
MSENTPPYGEKARRPRRIGSKHRILEHIVVPHNKALQLKANPLRGLSAAELGR